MKLFLSYSRKDVAAIESLTRGLKTFGHTVWLDQELSGGVEWWNAILTRIRETDAFLAIISRSSLTSLACAREREYAVALGKPVMPVVVERTPNDLLPPDLVRRQLVDYSTPSEGAAFALLGGIAQLPAAPRLPDPGPPPPDVPMSYLSNISAQLYQPTLTLDQQLSIVLRLRDAVADGDDPDVARELVALLERREDLYAVTQRQLHDMMASLRPGSQAVKEQTAFDVVLETPGESRIMVIKIVRELTSLSLAESKALVDGAPIVVLEHAPKDVASKAKDALEDAGATVTLK